MALWRTINMSQISADLKNVASEIDTLKKNGLQTIQNLGANVEQQDSSFCVPNRQRFLVGLDQAIINLKKHVLHAHNNILGVTGMSGVGKSTLASALCHDPDVKDFFGNKVIYIKVSKDPNLQKILEIMWKEIVGGPKPYSQDIEEAYNQLQSQISSRPNQATLVVLDDVWSMSKLEKLLFQGEKYKTLVTTRDANTIPKETSGIYTSVVYELRSLGDQHALSLFCHWAFNQPTIPCGYDENTVKQLQAKCGGLPLALKVIGSSLRDQSPLFWESAKNKLSKRKVISDYHKEGLLNSLKTSVDVLEDDQKQCFLDLAAFPQGRIISADALLDIWVNVRGVDWAEAYVILCEFAARNLLDLKTDPWSQAGISYGCVYGLSFSQHDVMRDLALYLGEQDKNIPCRRYIYPSNWQADRAQASEAQIVSIHTGGMDNTQWPQTEFSEAKVLLVFFTGSEYCIPIFLDTMKKLKVLIIHNYGVRRAKLTGVDGFKGLSQLRVLQLHGLTVPPLHEYCEFMGNLEKISLSLCEGLDNMSGSGRDEFFNFPGLLEINVDHCTDLEELPIGICCLKRLNKLSVTNCHLLTKLPDEMGKLGSLEVLRLCASPGLKSLPPSICRHGQLKALDISLCMHFKVDKRECSELKTILQKLCKLKSLKYVICDKGNEQLFKEGNSTLIVEAVKEHFSLDWLDIENEPN